MEPNDAHAVAEAVSQARARWPAIAYDPTAFAAALAARGLVATDPKLDLVELYLAHACAAADAAAIAAFEREYVAKIPLFLAKLEPVAAVIDEVCQRVRTRVLVAEAGGVPRIAEFGGRGPLAAWVRVVARSVHSNLRRDTRVDAPMDDAVGAPPVVSADLAALGDRHLPLVNRAVTEAIAGLPPRDRTLFKLHYIDGLALDRIGATYGVHKATVSRWLASARQAVLDAATRLVVAELGAQHADAQSLLVFLRSRLDVSVAAALGRADVAAIG